MANLKDLKIRIKSVKSTQKITSAMKMVAAAKLRRAQEAAEAARPYALRMDRMIASLGAKVSGATVHFVDDVYDNGPVILQEAVPVLEDDTPDILAERVQAKERELYPRAIQAFAQGRLRIEDRIVHVLPE